MDKIYISLDLSYLNLRWAVNPASPNPVVTCKQSAAHMTHLIPTEVLPRLCLVLHCVVLFKIWFQIFEVGCLHYILRRW